MGSGVQEGCLRLKLNCILKYGEVGIPNQMFRKMKKKNKSFLTVLYTFRICERVTVLLRLPWKRKEVTKIIHDDIVPLSEVILPGI